MNKENKERDKSLVLGEVAFTSGSAKTFSLYLMHS